MLACTCGKLGSVMGCPFGSMARAWGPLNRLSRDFFGPPFPLLVLPKVHDAVVIFR